MRKNLHVTSGQRGFTLIEVIAAIVLVGILGAIFVSYLSTDLEHSGDPVNMARDEAAGEQIMERINAEFVKQINTDPGAALANLFTFVQTNFAATATQTYVTFDAAGNEVDATGGQTTNNLKIVVQAGGHQLAAVFSHARTTPGDPKATY
jgi:prepilin-type N-terminal cleavage/methylation domain-containing protein